MIYVEEGRLAFGAVVTAGNCHTRREGRLSLAATETAWTIWIFRQAFFSDGPDEWPRDLLILATREVLLNITSIGVQAGTS